MLEKRTGLLSIVQYRESDHYGVIASWWKAAGEMTPARAAMPESSTFILAENGEPWVCVTVFLTNSSEIAWVDNLIANPELPSGAARKEAVEQLQRFLEAWALKLGYRKLFCMAANPALAERYRNLGYISTLKNVETFIKTLGE